MVGVYFVDDYDKHCFLMLFAMIVCVVPNYFMVMVCSNVGVFLLLMMMMIKVTFFYDCLLLGGW